SATDVLSWRALLEGTRDAHGKPIPERAWAGVAAGGRYVGLQEQYVAGVQQLDQAAAQMFPPATDFASLSGPQQDVVIARPDITAGFAALAFQHTAEGMYGAPEYGGNHGLVGWHYIGFPGDTQPRGWTAAEMLAPDPIGPPHFGSDEVKESLRHFSDADSFAEPRTFRSKPSDGDRTFTGFVNHLPTGVGGGTMHWDAKTPRFWELDFHLASTYGVPAGTTLADWPITYADLEPYYTRVEDILGVQGDASKHPDFLKAQTPRSAPYPMA